jgi:chitin synthase
MPTEYPQQGYRNDYESNPNWDSKSYQSSHAGSQAHLVPYEMAQVQHHIPPVPSVPHQQQYPPQRPTQYNQFLQPSHTGYSDAREKLLKRRSVRQVKLHDGNLVIEVPVPNQIVPADLTGQERDEMTKMRYTAATCDPDQFMSSRYSLRPYLMGRHTELFIVMTMYNEDEVLFVKTMNAYVTPSLCLLHACSCIFGKRHQEHCPPL